MNGPDLTQFDASALSKASAQTKMKTADSSRVRKTAEDFEAFFVSSMLESMFAGIKTDSMFGGGHGEDVFRSLMLQEYGKTIAKHGGIGIADNVQREMLRLQEKDQSR